MNRWTITRRAASVGLFAATTIQARAAASPDPIFAAIATAIEADAAFTALLKGLDENDEPAMQAANAASDRSSDAMNAIEDIIPTTTAGLHALIRYYAEDCARQDTYSVGAVSLGHLARCVERPALLTRGGLAS